MKNWQKRFIIWFNLAILFVFLDVSLLIFVRSIDHEGIYQTTAMKCEMQRDFLTSLSSL